MPSTELKLFQCIPVPVGDCMDVFELQSIRMALLHNIAIRSLNGLIYYSQTIQVKDEKLTPFLEYAKHVVDWVHHHHESEEEVWFPLLESKFGTGSMADNIAGHENFKAPFAAFEQLIAGFKAKEKTWDPEVFRQGIYAFTPVLREHLVEEIDTFRPYQLKERFTKEELDAFETEMKAWLMARNVPEKTPQILFANGDAVHGAWFPAMPPQFVAMIKGDLWKVHADWWEFGCCDRDMKVKPEFAAYEPVFEDRSKMEAKQA
ncbi:hypothetical protein FS837_010534 [Tulasnella sp. UAMH 9824]|nr:hypothetical protein FS837_010534 [Tulasnella sp. UAMH 9824]